MMIHMFLWKGMKYFSVWLCAGDQLQLIEVDVFKTFYMPVFTKSTLTVLDMQISSC